MCITLEGYKRASDALELELQLVVSSTWVLGVRPGTSGRVLLTAVLSLQPQLYNLNISSKASKPYSNTWILPILSTYWSLPLGLQFSSVKSLTLCSNQGLSLELKSFLTAFSVDLSCCASPKDIPFFRKGTSICNFIFFLFVSPSHLKGRDHASFVHHCLSRAWYECKEFLFKIYFYFLCMSVLATCMSAVFLQARKGHGSVGPEINAC